MDCKAERRDKELRIHSLHLEGALKKVDEFKVGLHRALEDFARFNRCERIDFGMV